MQTSKLYTHQKDRFDTLYLNNNNNNNNLHASRRERGKNIQLHFSQQIGINLFVFFLILKYLTTYLPILAFILHPE